MDCYWKAEHILDGLLKKIQEIFQRNHDIFTERNLMKLLEEIKKDICRDSGGILEAVVNL